MGILTAKLAKTGIDREVWEALARYRGTTIEEADRKADEVAAEPTPEPQSFPCSGERVTITEAAMLTHRQPVQIHRWIKMGAVHVYEKVGTRGNGAETIIDLGSVRGAVAALNRDTRRHGSRAVSAAVRSPAADETGRVELTG